MACYSFFHLLESVSAWRFPRVSPSLSASLLWLFTVSFNDDDPEQWGSDIFNPAIDRGSEKVAHDRICYEGRHIHIYPDYDGVTRLYVKASTVRHTVRGQELLCIMGTDVSTTWLRHS
jgi:hypothetical protein